MRFKISPSTETSIRSLLVFSAMLTLTGFLASFVTAGIGLYLTIGTFSAVFLASAWFSKEIALLMMSAKKVKAGATPEGFDLNRLVGELCKDPHINLSTCPKVYIIDSPQVNAFAMGRSRSHAAITITTGMLKTAINKANGDMEKAQRWIKAVCCHELGHVVHYDIATKSAIGMISMSLGILSKALYRQRRKQQRHEKNKISFARKVAEYCLFYIVIPFVGTLSALCLSRTREYAADDMATKCGRGEDLADALEQLFQTSGCANTSQTRDDSHLEQLNAILCFNPDPTTVQEGKKSSTNKEIGWFKWSYLQYKSWVSTHPPLDARIERLRKNSSATPA